MKYSLLIGIVTLSAFLRVVPAQIPRACSDLYSLKNSICCPDTVNGVCGQDANRGGCITLDLSGYSNESTDVGKNWPHYFTRVCKCNANYGGYDCTRCKYGHYGPNCRQSAILPRRSVGGYTDEDWKEFIEIIRLSKTYQSDYVVILEQARPGTSNLSMSNISLYDMYVWLHHFAAKDHIGFFVQEDNIDYAHFGPAFITWHRHFNLWLEHELQWMLKRLGRPNYHTYRLPYWDFRREIQQGSGVAIEDLLVRDRLGFTDYTSGLPVVHGTLFDGWQTVCALTPKQICNPNVPTGPVKRCPLPDRCISSNPDMPTLQRVDRVVSFKKYDAAPWNLVSADGFRSFIDYEVGSDVEACKNNRMCFCPVPPGHNCTGSPLALYIRMHPAIHVIGGMGDIAAGVLLHPNQTGSINEVTSSPNDPLFILHHTMVDCVFEEWLKRHPDGEYPDSPDVPQGHLRDGYMVPYFPLFTNNDMFKRAENFGYSCSLSDIDSQANTLFPFTWPVIMAVGLLAAIFV